MHSKCPDVISISNTNSSNNIKQHHEQTHRGGPIWSWSIPKQLNICLDNETIEKGIDRY